MAADDAGFVRQAAHLLEHEDAAAIGAAARARVLASYGWENSLSRFEQLLLSGSGVVAGQRTIPENVFQVSAANGTQS